MMVLCSNLYIMLNFPGVIVKYLGCPQIHPLEGFEHAPYKGF